MLKIDILSLFPHMFSAVLSESMLKRAQEKGLVEVALHNLRDWAEDKHGTVDEPPFGGGAGMVMKLDVIDRAVDELKQKNSKVVLLDTKGEVYKQSKARQLAREEHLILIVPHYEGVDHRVHENLADEIICLGNFVLTGGEIPAMALVDSVVRLVPGVLGNVESLEEESFGDEASQQIEYPQYTRPAEYRGWKVPQVLLSGDHQKIKEWRKEKTKS